MNINSSGLNQTNLAHTKLNVEKIKALRQERIWSQNHLAEVAGLSLRTIQRIESSGNASRESMKALAAVYELPVEDLLVCSRSEKSWRNVIVATVSSFIAVVSALFLLPASAESILLDAVIYDEQRSLANVQLLNETGKESELAIDGKLSVILRLTKVSDGQVRISSQIYDLSGDSPDLIAQPELLTNNKTQAEMKWGKYTISLTPHLNSASDQ
ncbi:helix-turn-helix transcriptional regulator [Aliikangiella marina]|uniref:Helix-turn-helix transcriptional regulator n=1 Tax=Aliikangiella marina TaxID=1712262 RepID=A0A545T726_9GAMM|nr:helix-turn-helix transcriptional regulator [Aliikangiella marina]TQV72985.1 helix-turn-helix transcriptional regulator [Aliikangiella marina]